MDSQDNKTAAPLWDSLLDQTFGAAEKPPLRRRPRFWLILAACAVLIGACGWLLAGRFAHYGSIRTLELCRTALENHQAQSVSKIDVTSTHSGDFASAYPTEHTYWRDGNSYLVKWYIDDGNHRPGWLLQTGGETYCKGIAPYYPEGIKDYTSWFVTDKIPEDDFTDWLDEYKWNDADITLLSTSKEDGNTLVIFTVAEELSDNIGGTADHRTVTFCLDKNGKLVYVQREATYSGIYEGNRYSSTTVVKSYVSYDKKSIQGMILGRISEIPTPYSNT